MKVKPKIETWQAVHWTGQGIPEEIYDDFSHCDVVSNHVGSGWHMQVSRWDQEAADWVDYEIYKYHWLVWSSFGKVEVLDDDEYKARFEEDDD
ncbi:hypothetical protein SEA_ATUIN_258 [Arthrobacter phage Atuin]|nr:hypothetical protein SEA_ATUIN_57 [Arthrobacter phage Atuin]